jgi:DNA-binding MarR family transcriptional regulator
VQNRASTQSGPRHPRSTAFLLAQIGAHAAARFAERLAGVGLVPAQAGILRTVAASAGISQQELASALGMLPSRLVPFLDELEERRMIERRDNPEDRRLYALHLTEVGTRVLADIGRVSRAHDDAVCAALNAGEREQLGALLRRIADEQGLTPGVHPGFSRVTARQKVAPSAAGPERRRSAKSRD